MTFDQVVARFQVKGRTKAGVKALCPAHDDGDASVTINRGTEGRTLVHCFADCPVESVLAAVGLSLADLFDNDESGPRTRAPRFGGNGSGKRTIIATYDYRDARGAVRHRTMRTDPKGFWQSRPDGKGGWIPNLDGVELLLYRLPELLAAPMTTAIWIPEGEGCVEKLVNLGVVATCNVGGAGKWRNEYNEHFRDRLVVILPDNDDPGRAHADKVARALVGIAKAIKIVPLPDLAPKGDVSDWLAAGGTKDQLVAITKAAPLFDPNMTAPEDEHQGDATSTDQNAKARSGKKRTEPTLAKRLVTLVGEAGAELFHTSEGQPFATVIINGHNSTFPLRSGTFRHWLERLFHERTGKIPSAQVVQAALGVLMGQARFDGAEHPVFTRLAEHEGAIYLDLADRDGTAVMITATGWQPMVNPPVKFRQTRGMLPLPLPVGGASIEVLRSFVNVATDADFILLVAWILAALRPRGPYPILAICGEQGSAKSTTARALRCVVDPNVAGLRAAPREPRDLMIAATNSWCLAFDNLSYLPSWLSDGLCRLATGGGFATRELYTDSEETIFDATRPVLVNGIEELATRGDLLDRCIVVELPTISDKKRRPEAAFWRDFDTKRPLILGVLLDAVVGALREQPHTTLDRLPRMADFALWATAAEHALSWKPGAFLAAYTGSRAAANSIPLEESLVAEPLAALLEASGSSWEGSAADLLKDLTDRVPERMSRTRTWPKSARALSGELRRLAPILRAAGIEVRFGSREPGTGRRLINIATRPSQLSPDGDSPREDETLSRDGRDETSGGCDADVTQEEPADKQWKARADNGFDASRDRCDSRDEDFADPFGMPEHSETCECPRCLPGNGLDRDPEEELFS